MTPLPPECAPIVAILRSRVPRPRRMPTVHFANRHLYGLRWRGPDGARCPLGLLPCATHPAPPCDWTAGIYGLDGALGKFWRWWDSLDLADAPAAMDAIWGPA